VTAAATFAPPAAGARVKLVAVIVVASIVRENVAVTSAVTPTPPAPVTGVVDDTRGVVLSTRVVTVAELVTLPATSATTMRRS
jgi:hypothetical protein